MDFSSKLKHLWQFSLLKSVYFNLHYLPLRQAIKLPILLRKPRFVKLRGKIVLDVPRVKTGMVQLGGNQVSIYPDAGIRFENSGGTIVFCGFTVLGNGTALSVGPKGTITFGDNFMTAAASKIVCYHSITFEPWVRIGWDTIVMDTDLHAMVKPDGSHTRGYGTIHLGRGFWCGTRCTILKNTVTPPHTTVAAGTKLGGKLDIPERTLIGTPRGVTILATDTYRDAEHHNDRITYPN